MATAPILAGDIKLVASQIMDDVPEGGGAPTSTAIVDGASNAIFPDISELDRAGGRINLRKLHVHVQTDSRDTYLGSNVIVADPPADPNVSVTLFSTKETFDRRAGAQSRVEAYLNKGPEWAGYLYENHIAGQRVIQLFQRPTDVLPNVGQTLVLVANEGLPNQKEQYVRATKVSSVERTFTYDADKDYKAAIVTMDLSDALRFDLPGSPASRTFTRLVNGTKVRDTVVADAGTYVGVVPLTQAAALGDFTVKSSSIYTQLVPSAQTETPLSDIRMNGLATALVATGGPLTRTLTLGFTPSQNLHVGGPIYPGTLSITGQGITVTDRGGNLVNAGAQVGTVDYANGIVTLSTPVFGSSALSFAVTFVPAALPEMVSEQTLVPITAEGRSLSYAFTLGTAPLPRTTSIAYLAQGRWYTLRDDGAGKLSGTDTSYGAGTVNYTTGSIVVTLGALPDVGSALVVQAYSAVAQFPASTAPLANNGKAYIPINTDGLITEEKGSKAIAPGSVMVGWSHGGAKVAIDDGLGHLTGDATGTVDYSAGVVRVSPNVLPLPGTPLLLDTTSNTGLVSPNVDLSSGDIGATNITPGSVSFNALIERVYTWQSYSRYLPGQSTELESWNFFDRAGKLYMASGFTASGGGVECGTINYATGRFTLAIPSNLPSFGFGPQVQGY
ncbi:hypothetical protein B2J88_20285 [Rhodococcus sp. SRB_17]|uniref:hypothetical protein n=1 Tax=Acidovorax sp. SRB_24 TaxID=1962700 RepID=UPI00145DFE44|nr:hypothetical protein [Acidovorax sp. SRB_24]NMM75390.1 hypothetical protein [Acidovorax sp. SRB_24]NMM86677.1 hypothetical protein [Rhodococcus sp. SRB_17]